MHFTSTLYGKMKRAGCGDKLKKMRRLHSRSQRKEACRVSNQDQFDSGGMT
jgi:hypothetical protein